MIRTIQLCQRNDLNRQNEKSDRVCAAQYSLDACPKWQIEKREFKRRAANDAGKPAREAHQRIALKNEYLRNDVARERRRQCR
jgi:hypothetical protein